MGKDADAVSTVLVNHTFKLGTAFIESFLPGDSFPFWSTSFTYIFQGIFKTVYIVK